jgi:3-deoxy-manno-octulosonate cytidylyltransferase (CMP-KDO synthetase)
MKVLGIIPARYQSSRFPGKPLVKLCGKPMILHVLEKTEKALGKENTYVATDDQGIADVVINAGYQVVMTSSNALTGTDRLFEAAQQLPADIYINVQGDEPLLDPNDICKIRDLKLQNLDSIINGMCKLTPKEDPHNVNIPKVITDEKQRLVYMSRLAVPGFKDAKNAPQYYLKQVCIYAFTLAELKAFGEFGRKSYLEHKEDIEILRFIDIGMPIMMQETSGASLAVDVEEDVAVVENAMRQAGNLS